MVLDAWLPVGFSMPDGERTKRVLYEGHDWQIVESQGGSRILVAKEALAKRWFESGLLSEEQMRKFNVADDAMFEITSSSTHELIPLSANKPPHDNNEALAGAEAFKVSRSLENEASFHDAIHVEKLTRLLPTYTLSGKVEDDVVFGTWLTGGVAVSATAFRRLRSLTPRINEAELANVVMRAGFEVSEQIVGRSAGKVNSVAKPAECLPKGFTLAGRPELEQFLNEHVIDIIEHEARYKSLGIEFPSAIILHGPPGCGKTFAIERLVDYLGWPSYQIDASSVASPYIHETSKKVAEVFEKAMQNAPSVLIMDEMEAFLSDRQMGAGSSSHRVEEVAEFLRRIPEAIKNKVLIVAMTNRIEMIDPAILRRGRFDHVIKVDMASEAEVSALLDKLLSDLPCETDIGEAVLAKQLTGRPLSDVSFVVREAARLAARGGKDKIDRECLGRAIAATPSRSDEATPTRKIGFT